MVYVCEYTKKRFKSLAAYENYKRSNKYKQLVARAGDAETGPSGAHLESDGDYDEESQMAAAIAASLQNQAAPDARPVSEEQPAETQVAGTREASPGGEDEGEADFEYESGDEESESYSGEVLSENDEEHQQMLAAAIQASLREQQASTSGMGASGDAAGSSEADEAADGLGHLRVGAIQTAGEWYGGEEGGGGEASSDEWVSGAESEWEEDWDSDNDGEWAWGVRMCESLFDGHVSDSFEANVARMKKLHSFAVPDLCALDDPGGLYAYLQEKVCRRHACLYCNRVFGTVEACRSHMRDVSHCRINFERDEIALDLAAAAFPLAAVPIARVGSTSERGAGAQSAFVDNDSTELVLPSGQRLGHRSLKHIYKQSKHRDAGGTGLVPHAESQREIEAKLALRQEAKRRKLVLRHSAGLALHGASKALSANYTHKADAADNKHARAVVHHWGAGGGGSHYNMAGSRQYQKGQKIKGVVLRHSRQGARLQAERNKSNRATSSVSVLH
jgi:pre-60S factor REI1